MLHAHNLATITDLVEINAFDGYTGCSHTGVRHGRPGDDLAVAGIEHEQDPDDLAISGVQLEMIRAPSDIRVQRDDNPIMRAVRTTGGMACTEVMTSNREIGPSEGVVIVVIIGLRLCLISYAECPVEKRGQFSGGNRRSSRFCLKPGRLCETHSNR